VYQQIIVGYDGSEHAEDALVFARMLAETVGGELTPVEVMPYEPLLSEVTIGPPTTLATQGELTRERLARLARSLDVAGEAVESRSPARGLHEAAERLEAELVIVGSSQSIRYPRPWLVGALAARPSPIRSHHAVAREPAAVPGETSSRVAGARRYALSPS
jgi:nucleotide-binding universal stress UspA family protein